MTIETLQFQVNSGDVVSETIEGEVVIINLSTGTYYSLGRAGADVWNLLQAALSIEEISDRLTQKYEGNAETIKPAVIQFVEQLQQEALIVPMPASDASTLPDDWQSNLPEVKLGFEPPMLQRYTDMQDLLLLDPIHEVDQEVGWPHKKLDSVA